MSVLEADANLFFRRIQRVYDSWDEHIKADSIVVAVGRIEEKDNKSKSLETWLFGIEISDILMVFCRSTIFFLASRKKIDYLKPLKKHSTSGNLPNVDLLIREKGDGNKDSWDKIMQGIKSSGKGSQVGLFMKDKFAGDFFSECQEKIFSNANDFTKVDISKEIAVILAVKEDLEIQYIKYAASTTENAYVKMLLKELKTIIDKEKKVAHRRLSEKLHTAISDNSARYLDIPTSEAKYIYTCYTPIIQSGGTYNLKFSAVSNNDNIHCQGLIISCVGLRYKSYCSNISRTLMIAPTEEQKKNYGFLVKLSDELINGLTDGVVLSDLYDGIVQRVKKERPDLVDKLTKNFGYVTGLEFREGHLVIGPKTDLKAKKNMTFIVSIGFSDITNRQAVDSKSRNYSLFVSDTVVVKESGSPAELLTTKKRQLESAMILFKSGDDDSDEEDVQEEASTSNGNDATIANALRGGTRRRNLESKLRMDQNNEKKRKEHQSELMEQLNIAARARLLTSSNDTAEPKVKKSIIAYKSQKDFPRENEIRDLRIYVDKKHETLILPIFGIPVPFHISTVKNVSSSIEGDYLYLRINFYFPGSTLEKGSVFANNEATFLKELTYRSLNIKEPGEVSAPSQNLSDSIVTIKTVQKKYKTRVDEEKELEGVVKQDNLIVSSTKVGPKLKDLFIRPNIYPKRISGSLEAHSNGFRFTSIRNDKVDIMFNNIKHAIYQPCDNEMIILLHFNLKNPIMLNKKKHLDIQFYTEVGEITTDLGKRQHMHDRDDYAAETAERELRNRLKQAFKIFCDKVENATKGEISFEVPMRELGFYGVPKKSNVFLAPTASALVNLTDSDPTVITLSEIELVHFERVTFQLKNFDMVIVFKNYLIKPLSIAAVEMSKLEDIKNWLDKCDIRFTSGAQSLNWPVVMKKINSDYDLFFEKEGGWTFLESDESGEEADDEEETDDEQYKPSEDENEDEEDEEEDEEESEEEDVTEDESGSAEMGSSEESGKDWSELEEEAARDDRANHRDYDDTPKRSNGTGAKRKRAYDDGRSSKRSR